MEIIIIIIITIIIIVIIIILMTTIIITIIVVIIAITVIAIIVAEVKPGHPPRTLENLQQVRTEASESYFSIYVLQGLGFGV